MSRHAAKRLAVFAGNHLVVFRCPQVSEGWHVCAPEIEITVRTRTGA
ncbi:MAG TPA: hypothetical protein VGJ13_11405 [Pseudonocardiaceae bacterium]